MADEELAIAPSGLETAPAPDAIETTPAPAEEPTKVDDLEGEATETEPALATEPEIETIEIEWDDGKKYTIPKAIEAGVLKNKDYTTKTQEAAALRKQLESREAEINQRAEATEAELTARAQLQSVTARLEEYAKLTAQDWAVHRANDPIGTENAWTEFQLLKDQKGQLEGLVTKAQSERTAKQQQDLAKRVQETLSEAPKIIPGWTPETGSKQIAELVEFAQSEGIPDQVLQNYWSPQLLKLLHRASLGTNLLKKQTAPAKPMPAPLQTVTGKASAPTAGDLGSLDMEAYVAARKRGVGGTATF